METFKGIYPALVTPFDKDGHIDGAMIQKLIEHNLKKGVSGFYVCGSSGESYLLSLDERRYVIDAASEACRGRCPLIVHAGLIATEHTVALAEHAEKRGAAAVSSVPPFYFPFTEREVIGYYRDLAEAVSLPVVIYNIPAMSGVKFSGEALEKLLAIPSVIGVKHTSTDLFQLERLIDGHPDKTFFIGYDELFLSALAIGIKAGIGTTYNIMAEKFIELISAFETGDAARARNLQGQINDVISVLGRVGVFKGTKAILKLQGFDCGECRRPFEPLDAESFELVKRTAVRHGLI